MNQRPAASSHDSFSRDSPVANVPVSDTAGPSHAERPQPSGPGREIPDQQRWHEAGPAAGLVARKWALDVLRVLDEHGPTRFNDLRRKTGAASQPLKATLEALAQAGLVNRHVTCAKPPPSVFYSLTSEASNLFPVLSSLADWQRTSVARRAAT